LFVVYRSTIPKLGINFISTSLEQFERRPFVSPHNLLFLTAGGPILPLRRDAQNSILA
jgi:hypothetical protein